MHGFIWERWWFRVFVAIVLFFSIQTFLSLSNLSHLEEGRSSLVAQIEELERRQESLRMDIFNKERDLVRYNRQIAKLDTQIKDKRSLVKNKSVGQTIYFITPTAFRPAQKADLTRLANTLSLVPNLHWIVVEDNSVASNGIEDVLKRSFNPYTHLFIKTPATKKMNYSQPNWYLPRGVEQRNLALNWIRTQLEFSKSGIVYFGDDDNAYDLRLFEEMRTIKNIGVWPVGIVGGQFVETPIVKNGKVVGFDAWKPERPFPVDMAAFAIHVTAIVAKKNATFTYDAPRGFQESQFFKSLGFSRDDLEPKAANCTKVYVWHTRTEKSKLSKMDIQRMSDPKNFSFSLVEADALGISIL